MPTLETAPEKKEAMLDLERERVKTELVQKIMYSWKQLEDLLAEEEAGKNRSLTDEEIATYRVAMRFGKQAGNQWIVTLSPKDYQVTNPRLEDGIAQFYEMHSGKYDNPVYTIEPDLAFSVPTDVVYVNAQGETVQPNEKIGGIVCQNPDGSTKIRTSLSNRKAPEFTQTTEGLQINGQDWYLCALVSKDKNRAYNYDAFYREKKPAKVKVVELAYFEI